MGIQLNSPKKIVYPLLLALCLFASCKEPAGPGNGGNDGDDDYYNPNADASRTLKFSHDSGLYAQQFSLTLTVPEGSSIYYTTDGSIPSPGKAGTNKYSTPITVQNRNGQANILATNANSTQMYMVSNDPRGSAPTIYTPSNAQVPKATVIRAIAVDAKGKKSGVLTKTYFIGNNLANYGSARILSLVSDPYNLVDQAYGIMVRGASSNRWPNYNFNQKGQDWERAAYLELFEGNASSRSVKLSTGVGIRVRGGWSRAAGQKSFTVYFREEQGINNLRNYNLIPGAVKADGKTPVEIYKSFMLRNGANDGEYTKFYDVFLQDLVSDRSFTAQAGVPCVVYLNGEYWGPYNLQERYSDNHTEYKYGVNRNNVISYDNGELDDGNPGDENLFLNLVNGLIDGTVSYANFCNAFDIDNFIDYWAAEIYIYNEDWPQNNYRVWRTRTIEPGNPYGDTKWRWQMFDTEYAIGIYNSGQPRDAFDKILNGEHKGHFNNKLFKALLANPDFCRKFVNTMMDLYNVNFHPDSFNPKLNSYEALYRPLMGDTNTPGSYFSRWGRPWDSVFQNKVDDAKNYLNDIRNVMAYTHLPKYFGSSSAITNIGISGSNLRDVTLSATGVSGASIKINTVTPSLASGSWTGKYYSGNPVTVTASAPPGGYEFYRWSVSGGTAEAPSNRTTTVSITGNAQITAFYKQTGDVIVPVESIALDKTSLTIDLAIGQTANLTATVTPPNATYNTVLWSSSNPNAANVDNNGNITAVRSGTATITASTAEGKNATCTVTVTGTLTLLDLAAKLQTLPTQVIDDGDKFNAAFGDIPVSATGPGGLVTYAIITENGINKLQVNEHAMWGPGFDIANIEFQDGDKIEVKGRYLGGDSNGMQIQVKFTANYDTLRWWWMSSGENFQETITLTAQDAAAINANGNAFRLRTNGKDPWASPGDSNYQQGYVARFVIEQVKVYR
jgi:hypothetical protein